ncbi:MAG: HAMP domain-containing protein [Calditrichaeota bacterium]|nr:HAMP domain-containing protein [Calditrichota bacterium]
MKKNEIDIKYRFITKLLISHILMASVPVILVGFVLIGTANRALQQSYRVRTMELVKHSAMEITMTLDHAVQALRFNASNLSNISTNKLTQELIINEIYNEFPIFRDLKLIDSTGKIILSTSFLVDSSQFVNASFLRLLKSGNSYRSDVFLQEDRLPAMRLAEPIFRYNEFSGALIADVNLKEMWDLIESSVSGSQAQAFIFDRNGRFIAHSERKRVYLGEKFEEGDVLQKVALDSMGQSIYANKDGVKMVAAFIGLPKYGWGVVFQQRKDVAFALADKMKKQILLFVAIFVALSSVIAAIYTRWIVTPVNQLISGIEQFERGDLRYRIPLLGRDEISMLAERFNEMASRLIEFQQKLKRSERAETLNKLASVLSHEIKNPLNAMVINMQIMEREMKRSAPRLAKLRHYLEIVAAEIQRVDNLVNNFLLVARPPKLERNPVNMRKILDDLIVSQQAEARQAGVRVSRRYAVDEMTVLLDEGKMRQVFLNIFLNALQAMPGGGNLTIELGLLKKKADSDQPQCAVIRFRDTGKGIKAEDLPFIFDFYYSTKEGGTGLGLSIAQQIVEEHNGRIEAESEEGGGAVFSIFLPIKNFLTKN